MGWRTIGQRLTTRCWGNWESAPPRTLEECTDVQIVGVRCTSVIDPVENTGVYRMWLEGNSDELHRSFEEDAARAGVETVLVSSIRRAGLPARRHCVRVVR